MSGIATLINWHEPSVDPERIEQMLDRIPHRSTEGRAVLCGAQCAMGFARHATSARERAAAQPARHPQSGLLCVADARLDNREALYDSLLGTGRPELTDPELLLLGYERWGADLADHLI